MVRTTSTDRLKELRKEHRERQNQIKMPKATKDSKTRKDEIKKEYRQRERGKKRFNQPLTGFLETKYPEVYEEYKKLYDWLDKNNPQVRNLSKTSTFKMWKKAVQDQRASENTPANDNNNDSTSENTPANDNNNDRETTASENTSANDNNNDSTTETASENTPANDNNNYVSIEELADIMVNIEGQVDEIMNELRQDADLRQIMDEVETQTDEGIDISPLDDIEFDIQPFNFELEVENYPW